MSDKKTSKCVVCGGEDWEIIKTYKHRWHSCNDCNSVFARKKDRYLMSYEPARTTIKLLNRLFRNKLRRVEVDFLKDERANEDESVSWDWYADMLRSGSGLEPWEKLRDEHLERLRSLGIEYRGKRILIISGGPGILAKGLAEFSDVIITEFSADVVKAMKDHLGLNSVCFDFNTQRLEDVVEGKFDLVFLEGVINWCNDQKGFARSIAALLNDRAVVLIDNATPALGYMLTWQFMDHMATEYVHNQALLSFFHQAGRFKLIANYQNKYNSYWYRFGTGGSRNKLHYLMRTPFWLVYGAMALFPCKNLNRKGWSSNNISMLQFSSDASRAGDV